MIFKFKWTAILSLTATPFLLLLFFFIEVGEYFILKPAIILFPWGLIGILLADYVAGIFVVLTIIQYPVYGILLDLSKRWKSFKAVAICMVSLHVLLAVLILILRDNFWR